MNEPISAKVAGLRLLLFLVLPIAIMVALELVVPLSILLSSVLFLPFQAHSLDPRGPHFTIFAQTPWDYIFNGAFVVGAALTTVAIGRRRSFRANLALYFGVTIGLAIVTHAVLIAAGFPFGSDSP
jgi:hypothetical protein